MGAIDKTVPYAWKGGQTSTAGVANIAGFKAKEPDGSDHWTGPGNNMKQMPAGDMSRRLMASPFGKK